MSKPTMVAMDEASKGFDAAEFAAMKRRRMITYKTVIVGILKDRGIDADPAKVEDAMKKRHPRGLDKMRAGRFTSECVSVALEIEREG